MNDFVKASLLHANLPQANLNDMKVNASSPLKINHTPTKAEDAHLKSSSSLNSPSRKSRKKRTKITEEQLALLKLAYEENCIPDYGEREILAEKTGLSIRVVQVWFQNRRAYQKRNKDMKTNSTPAIGIANGTHLSKSSSYDVLNMPQFGDVSESSAESSPKNILGYSSRMDSLVGSKLSSMSSPMLSHNLSASLPQSMMLEKKLSNSNGKNKSKISKTYRNSGSRSKRNAGLSNSSSNEYGVEHGAQICLSDYDTSLIKRRFSSTKVPQPACFSLKNENLQRSQSLTSDDLNSFLYNISCGISDYQELDMNDVSGVMSKRSDPMMNMEVDESLESKSSNHAGQNMNFVSSGSLSYADSTDLSRVQSHDILNECIFPMASCESNAVKTEIEHGYTDGDLFSMDFDFNFNVAKNIGINIDNIMTSNNDDAPMNHFLDGLITTDT